MAENSRTHEPSLRELCAELDGFKALMEERDRRYAEIIEAQKAAMKAAFEAADKAFEKTEVALKEYKAGANEWRDTVKDLISNLRESRSSGTGRAEHVVEIRAFLLALIGIAISLAGLVYILTRAAPGGQP